MTVYFAQAGERVKIGWAKDAARRLRELQTGCPVPLRIVREIPGGGAEERWLHWRYRDLRLEGEWFRQCPTMDTITVPDPPIVPKPPKEPRMYPSTDRHILFDADILDGLLAAAPSERTQLSGLVNKICEDWLRRRRTKGGAA